MLLKLLVIIKKNLKNKKTTSFEVVFLLKKSWIIFEFLLFEVHYCCIV